MTIPLTNSCEVVKHAPRDALTSGWCVNHGSELQGLIGPEYWCITRSDLLDLRCEVLKAIKDEIIKPTEHDSFDPLDQQYGPSIYTVCEQFIKPVTERARKPSWALMKHPEGLKCDVFVTHAWQEGVFEFIDKVVNSWPQGARHAWCCMLANPQNLNISELIKNPRTSPFAVALRTASCMLVVPNRHGSIYSRLWCCYEAFLASEWDKTIVTASASCRRAVLRALFIISSICVAVVIICMLCIGHANETGVTIKALLSMQILHAPLFISVCIEHSVARLVLNHIIACLATAAICIGEMDTGSLDMKPVFLCVGAFVLEVDRITSNVKRLEATSLSAGYTGSVLDAHCSEDEDKRRILHEIGDSARRVDGAVDLLIRAGMSTSSLRDATERGVDVSGVSYGQPWPTLTLGIYLMMDALRYAFVSGSRRELEQGVIHGVMDGELYFLLVILWLSSSPDARAFAVRVWLRLGASYFFIWGFALQPLVLSKCLNRYTYESTDAYLTHMFALLAFTLAAMGLRRTSRLPWCGRCLAQSLIGKLKLKHGCMQWARRLQFSVRSAAFHDVELCEA